MELAQYYYTIHIHIVLFGVLYNCLWLYNSDSTRIISKKRSALPGVFYALMFTVIVGLRPVSWVFTDMTAYSRLYEMYQLGFAEVNIGDGDWLFAVIMQICSQIMVVNTFFLIIEMCYIIPIIIACKRLIPNNTTLAILFCFTAFSFFAYGTNTIRNGMASSLVILALSYINGSNRDKVIAALISLAAISTHKSVTLPILMAIFSLFYRNTRMIICFWVLSIFASLTIGSYLESFFIGLGFDDRLSDYITNDQYDYQFTSSGFRFDFLLYSVMPIVLGYYVVIRKGISDTMYLILLHTYILSNAIWVMLIYASFSDRFAYLSWFLYPLVLAYPLLKFEIWENNQGRKCAYILLGQIIFTYLMWWLK